MERNSLWKNPWSFLVAQLFFLPVLLVIFLGLFVFSAVEMDASLWMRIGLLCRSYLSFFFVVSALTIAVSARSKQAKNALLKLLVFGCFLWFSYLNLRKPLVAIFPYSTKLTFNAAIDRR